jgi:hypothetical protein
MAVREETGRGAAGKGHFEWSTVPMAHSPQGFAELPYPWQAAKAQALRAQRGLDGKPGATGTKPGKAKGSMQRPAVAAQTLATLTGRLGHDRGPARNRAAELYDMLFRPYRHQPITLVELGIGQDDLSSAAPAAQLWLDYFDKAQVIGVDQRPVTIRDDRYTHHLCDLADRKDVARLGGVLPVPEIIIDDASHASLHQQTALLELFPKLASGGLYIIEGLRTPPEPLETAGFTRTADLLRGCSETRVFRHSDPAMAQALAGLMPDIAGCFLFQVGFDKRRKDQIAVIHKA